MSGKMSTVSGVTSTMSSGGGVRLGDSNGVSVAGGVSVKVGISVGVSIKVGVDEGSWVGVSVGGISGGGVISCAETTTDIRHNSAIAISDSTPSGRNRRWVNISLFSAALDDDPSIAEALLIKQYT